jgi:hypothetical protein
VRTGSVVVARPCEAILSLFTADNTGQSWHLLLDRKLNVSSEKGGRPCSDLSLERSSEGLPCGNWGEEMREYAGSRTVGARKTAAKMIRTFGKRAEDALDRTKDQVDAVAQSGQGMMHPTPTPRH